MTEPPPGQLDMFGEEAAEPERQHGPREVVGVWGPGLLLNDVLSVRAGWLAERPDVLVEIRRVRGGWVIWCSPSHLWTPGWPGRETRYTDEGWELGEAPEPQGWSEPRRDWDGHVAPWWEEACIYQDFEGAWNRCRVGDEERGIKPLCLPPEDKGPFTPRAKELVTGRTE